jgi:hypothetical protein
VKKEKRKNPMWMWEGFFLFPFPHHIWLSVVVVDVVVVV